MRFTVLGPTAPEGDRVPVALDLPPLQRTDLFPTCCGQEQHLYSPAHWPADVLGAFPYQPQFVITQHSIPPNLSARLRQVCHRVGCDDTATYCPAEQPMQVGMTAPGKRSGAAVGN